MTAGKRGRKRKQQKVTGDDFVPAPQVESAVAEASGSRRSARERKPAPWLKDLREKAEEFGEDDGLTRRQRREKEARELAEERARLQAEEEDEDDDEDVDDDEDDGDGEGEDEDGGDGDDEEEEEEAEDVGAKAKTEERKE